MTARAGRWWSAAVVVLAAMGAAGCRESTVAPGQCPELCPAESIQVVDTVLTGIVVSDTSYRPFVAKPEAAILRLSNDTASRSVGVLQFYPRPAFWFAGNLTDTIRIATIDSVTLKVQVTARDTTVNGVTILVYRVPRPRSIDTLTTYDSIAPWIADSLLIDTIPVPDSLVSGLVTRRLPVTAFQPDPADSNIVSALLVLDAPQPTGLHVTASGFTGQAQISWYATAADTAKHNTFTAGPSFDSFVQSPEPPAMLADRRFVGNLPSARALLRFAIPRALIDSVTVIRAMLVLSPVTPPTGAPDATFTLVANGVVRDFGPKSIFSTETALTSTATVTVGDTAQVELSLTTILRSWRGVNPDTVLPRSLMLRVSNEGRTTGELAFAPAGSGPRAPFLRLTFIRPYRFGLP